MSKAAPSAADAVVLRLREVYGCASDSALARRLRVGTSTINNWRARGSVPAKYLTDAALTAGVSLAWLTGADLRSGEEPAPYTVTSGGTAAPAADAPDPRLAAVLEWWAHWWAGASEDDKVWALVQMRRAFPEAAEWLRRRGF